MTADQLPVDDTTLPADELIDTIRKQLARLREQRNREDAARTARLLALGADPASAAGQGTPRT